MSELETIIGTPVSMHAGNDTHFIDHANSYSTMLLAVFLDTYEGQKLFRMYGKNSPMTCVAALVQAVIDEGKEAERLKQIRPTISFIAKLTSETHPFSDSYFVKELKIKRYNISWETVKENYKMTVTYEKTTICSRIE